MSVTLGIGAAAAAAAAIAGLLAAFAHPCPGHHANNSQQTLCVSDTDLYLVHPARIQQGCTIGVVLKWRNKDLEMRECV